jgi:hypothetical protein
MKFEGAYTLLQTSYFMPTFLHGRQGNISNTENTFLDDIDTLEYDNIIVYGIRGYNMIAYTYGELADTFSQYKRFQRPDGDGEIYSDISISKLYLLCHKNQRPDESNENFRERLSLGEEIDRVKLYQDTNQEQVKEFVDRYEKYSQTDKDKVNEFLNQLLTCGMYMRGWNGEGEYPLTGEDAMFGPEELPEIEVRVTNGIIKLEETVSALSSLDNMDTLVKELPLIFYHHRSDELLPSTNREEGLTIYDRINIVKGGEDGSIQSCIRMSSNRFCASAYYYMNLLGLPIPFNIQDMVHIL